jgi:RNA polymerase sigma-70 factor (ECF subfamily)
MSQRPPAEDRPARQHLPDPQEWPERYGDALYRYALARLRRPHEAEEAVQETLLAALQARDRFEGRSRPATWLTGILKHKVLQRLRAAARAAPTLAPDDLDAWFDARGKWRRPPEQWDGPEGPAERSEFWDVVRRCLNKLPARMAAAFTLRTLDERPPPDVCRELAVSAANLWVLLHRARLRLVRCLQRNWFDGEEGR